MQRDQVESALRDWLAGQCQSTDGAESALAVVGASEHALEAVVVGWPDRASVSPRLSATVELARNQGRIAAQVPGDGERPGATTDVAFPLLRDGSVIGAVGVSLAGAAASDAKTAAETLSRNLSSLVLPLGEAAEAEGHERLGTLLSFVGSVLDHPGLPESAYALATELAQRLGAERVAIGLETAGRMRLHALSTSLRFRDETGAVQDLVAAMQEAVEQDAVIALPDPNTAPHIDLDAHECLMRSANAGAVCSVPLAAHGERLGAITCEWREPTIPPSAPKLLQDAGALCGPMLDLLRRAEAGPRERARRWVDGVVDRYFGSNRGLARATVAVAVGVLLVLAVVPAPYRVSARASLEGRVQRALVAAVPGYLAEANARAGDVVRSGDVLARLDDRDLRLEHRKWQSQHAQLQREYREALAGQDRTQVSILAAQIERAAAQLGLAEEQLGRTEVVAPFDGIVLEGDLDRALGSPVELGSVLFEMAPLDGYRIIVQTDDRDIADVAVGQRGRLALAALPQRTFPLRVERVTPISTQEDGRNYFRVEAVLEEPSAELRPGMEGIAKVEVGSRRLLWIWTHGLVDWVRLATWSFLP